MLTRAPNPRKTKTYSQIFSNSLMIESKTTSQSRVYPTKNRRRKTFDKIEIEQ